MSKFYKILQNFKILHVKILQNFTKFQKFYKISKFYMSKFYIVKILHVKFYMSKTLHVILHAKKLRLHFKYSKNKNFWSSESSMLVYVDLHCTKHHHLGLICIHIDGH